MFLLDTDVLSNLLKRTPSTQLIARLAIVPTEQQATTSITLGELVYGAQRLAECKGALLVRIDDIVLRDLTVLPFDTEAARSYGRLRTELERDGAPLADADLRIAAIAIARRATVITGNVRHFACVPGLQIENWIA